MIIQCRTSTRTSSIQQPKDEPERDCSEIKERENQRCATNPNWSRDEANKPQAWSIAEPGNDCISQRIRKHDFQKERTPSMYNVQNGTDTTGIVHVSMNWRERVHQEGSKYKCSVQDKESGQVKSATAMSFRVVMMFCFVNEKTTNTTDSHTSRLVTLLRQPLQTRFRLRRPLTMCTVT